jgi:chromosome segregation ATPase
VDRVRQNLGTGSKSTIAPLLKRWRTDNSDATEVGGLPNDLVDVMKSLHERFQQVADQRIEHARQEFNALSEALHKDLSEAGSTIEQLADCQQDLEKQVKQLTDEKNLQSRSLEDTRINLAKTETQRDEVLERAVDLKETIAQLKQENRDIRDHFEHYQQQIAEDKQHEREQFRSTNHQLQEQIHDLKNQLTQGLAKTAQFQDTNTELQGNIDELEKVNINLNNKINRMVEEIKSQKWNLEVALEECKKYRNKMGQLTEQMSNLNYQKAEAEKEVALLSQGLGVTKMELKSTQGKVELLSDENKVILQEKAMIQGQFKQLQSSL